MSGVIAGMIGSMKGAVIVPFVSLIPNGDWETGAVGVGWTFGDPTVTKVTTADKYAGTYSLSTSNNISSIAYTNATLLTLNAFYSLSLWVKCYATAIID